MLLRETLEGVLAPNVAASLLFEALGDWEQARGELADDHVGFVHGPLMQRLVKRVGTSEAASVADQILARLGAAQAAPRGPATPKKAATFADRRVEERATTPLPLWQLPVVVVVVSSQPDFATRLALALGADRVAALTVASGESFVRACEPYLPGVIVVDAGGSPPIPAREMAALLDTLPPTVVRTLWRSDTDYGKELARAADDLGIAVAPLFGDGDDRIAPLCDIIRSLRRPPSK